MDQWLIRTAQNLIAGPYPKDQICQMIQERKIGIQDEVCQANGYWFFLHEREEVQRFLGIQVPRPPRGKDDEITETDTEALDGQSNEGSIEKSNPDLDYLESLENAKTPEDTTAVIMTDSFRKKKESPEAKQEGKEANAKPQEKAQEKAQTKERQAPPENSNGQARSEEIDSPRRSHSPSNFEIHVAGRKDAIPVWKGVIWLLLAGGLVAVVAVFRLMKP